MLTALFALAGAVLWALAMDDGSESTSGTARSPAASDAGQAPPSTAQDATGEADAAGDELPGGKDRAAGGAAQASGSGAGTGEEEPESSHQRERNEIDDLRRGGTGGPRRRPAQPELPPKVAKLLLSNGGGQAPSDLPPELRELLPEGIASGR
jgi:hypothetical protein